MIIHNAATPRTIRRSKNAVFQLGTHGWRSLGWSRSSGALNIQWYNGGCPIPDRVGHRDVVPGFDTELLVRDALTQGTQVLF